MNNIIGVDVGGTQIRAARFASDLAMEEAPIKCDSPTDRDAFLKALYDTIRKAMPAQPGNVLGIGVGLPGPIDNKTGVLIAPPNLPVKGETPMRDLLEAEFGLPVLLGNDADLAGLGEFQQGAGRGTRTMIYLTISTGVGGGIIIDGKPFNGQGLGAEIGHMVVDPHGPMCGCGKPGHLEAFSSGTGIANNARARIAAGEASMMASMVEGKLESINASLAADAARRGDLLALDLFEQAGSALGVAMASLMTILNPERFVLGGGMMKSYDLLEPHVDKALTTYLMHPRFRDGTSIARAELADNAGLIGAATLVYLNEEAV